MSVHQYSPQKQKKIEVRQDTEQLSDNKGCVFYSAVKNILFIMKNFRPYLDTAISFLTTGLSKIDVDDWVNCEGS